MIVKIEPIRGVSEKRKISLICHDKVVDYFTMPTVLATALEKNGHVEIYSHRLEAAIKKYESAQDTLFH